MAEPQRRSRETPTANETVVERTNQPRVLIVDDEPMIASLVARMIGKEHEVHISHNSVEARDRICGGERFDAIFCDLAMPEMTGVELHAEVIQCSQPQAERMIFMTGGAFTETSRTFLDRIPNLRVDKPFEVANVRSAVRQVIQKWGRVP